jgi:IclR family acetate operon transcriptional repressor
MLESRRGLRMSARAGARDPLHSTSLGKAILAFTPAAKRASLIDAALPLARLTPNTIVELPGLLADLAAARERGYAIDNQENEIGAICVGAPILNGEGEAIAGVSVSGPASRLDAARIDLISARLIAACADISRRMGQPATAPVRGSS